MIKIIERLNKTHDKMVNKKNIYLLIVVITVLVIAFMARPVEGMVDEYARYCGFSCKIGEKCDPMTMTCFKDNTGR